jgi:hypothetical protein
MFSINTYVMGLLRILHMYGQYATELQCVHKQSTTLYRKELSDNTFRGLRWGVPTP